MLVQAGGWALELAYKGLPLRPRSRLQCGWAAAFARPSMVRRTPVHREQSSPLGVA
jgi:hypothetical protein